MVLGLNTVMVLSVWIIVLILKLIMVDDNMPYTTRIEQARYSNLLQREIYLQNYWSD